jgi:hypothetical protein
MFDSSNQYDPNQQTIAGFNQVNNINPSPDCPGYSANPALNQCLFTTNDRRPFYNGDAQQLGVRWGSPFGWTQGFRFNNNQATASYNALQVIFQKRYSQGVQLLAHYTWSNARSHESYYFLIDPRVGYGNSYYNRPQAFVLAPNWDLPIGKGKPILGNAHGIVNQLVGGFSVNGTLSWQSGLPFTPSYSLCSQDQDLGICRPDHTEEAYQLHVGSLDTVNHRRPFFTPSPYGLGSPTNPGPQDPVSFGPYSRPAIRTFGNIERDSLYAPNLFNTDLSVAKYFNFTERAKIQFRADAFNVFNKVNLNGPNGCVDCQDGSAGTISSTIASPDGNSMRRLQFSARFEF